MTTAPHAGFGTHAPGALELGAGTLTLDGVPSVLLCSSVFPFRLPPATWEHRLRLVKESGYRMVDLYVHWGFHETTEGRIDLESPPRDLARFLRLCAERDLLVMARPGPYICSETDGGGLPAWLHGDRQGRGAISLRTTDPQYLQAVDRWFDAVMPLLAAAQTTRGGPVALVQIENELDFFDCPDAPEYMAHLAERARAHGIEVPIFACAGQGDLAGATGEAPGVVPSANFYPDDADPDVDQEVRHYARQLAARDLPLMVTETNRVHRTLRREILAGARLIAPYLQTGGFNHLLNPSAGNWGDPGNLMTHDYDFGGYVTPDGRRTPEYAEAQRLARTLQAWGTRLATATPIPLDDLPTSDEVPTSDDAPASRALPGGALRLVDGGWILGPAELTGNDTRLRVGPEEAPLRGTVAAGTCPFWCLDVPLDAWGRRGLLRASAELVGASERDGTLTLRFEGTPDAEVAITAPTGEDWTLTRTGYGSQQIVTPSGPIRIELAPPADAAVDPAPTYRPVPVRTEPLPDLLETHGERVPYPPQDPAPQFETLGLTGGRLRTAADVPDGTRELLLLGAADLVDMDIDGRRLPTYSPHGAPIRVPLAPAGPHHVSLTTELWGHANFDDARRPTLAIGSGRGPGTVLAIEQVQDVGRLWLVTAQPSATGTRERPQPAIRNLGGWSSTELGGDTIYTRALQLPTRITGAPSRRAALHLPALSRPVRISLDGATATMLPRDAPILLLPPDRHQIEVSIRAPHTPEGLCDGAELLIGREVTGWEVTALGPEALAAAIGSAESVGTRPQQLPLRVDPGRPQRVHLHITRESAEAGVLLDLAGTNVRITVTRGGRQVSRHVLADGIAVSGGPPGRSWIPASWMGEATEVGIELLVEATSPRGGSLEQIAQAPAVT